MLLFSNFMFILIFSENIGCHFKTSLRSTFTIIHSYVWLANWKERKKKERKEKLALLSSYNIGIRFKMNVDQKCEKSLLFLHNGGIQNLIIYKQKAMFPI